MQLLKDSPFHVRKEAAYAIANICAGGGGGTGDLEALNWLFAADRDALAAMVSLMRSADMDAAKLGLQVGLELAETLSSHFVESALSFFGQVFCQLAGMGVETGLPVCGQVAKEGHGVPDVQWSPCPTAACTIQKWCCTGCAMALCS